jgi:ADP-heptose:LPS heptosyltransferase
MTTPLIRSLRKRFPYARIDMVVREDYGDLVKYNPHLDTVILFPHDKGVITLLTLARRLSRERYDIIYDVHRSLRSRLLMLAVSGGTKLRYPRQYFRRALMLIFKITRLQSTIRLAIRWFGPLARFDVHYDFKATEIFVSSEAKSAVIQKFPELASKDSWVGLVPSARWPGKRWPEANVRKLVQQILDKTPWRLLIFAGPEDGFCSSIAEKSDRVLHAMGLSLAEVGAALNVCSFVVANDTGLMHMADALGKPVVLILGPTTIHLGCKPFHPLSRIVEKESLWCRPCSKNGQAPCIRGHRHCLDIPVDEVMGHVLSLGRNLGLC